MANELLVTFDVRAPEIRQPGPLFLLKAVSCVRSVDTFIWPSLSEEPLHTIDYLARHPLLREGTPVTISWIPRSSLIGGESEYFRALNSGCTPQFIPKAAELLGYDVADVAMLSGLLNCSYGAEHLEFSQKWGKYLNDFHLFKDSATACEFAEKSDLCVPEHRPFFAFGIYKLGML